MNIDQELIEQIKHGNDAALEKLINYYYPKVKAIVIPIVGIDNAQDVIQDAWISIIRHIKKFKGQAAFTTWLYRIFYNQAQMHIRKTSIQVEHDNKQPNATHSYFDNKGHWHTTPHNWHIESPHTFIHLIEFEHSLFEFIATLPKLQASFLVMHDIEQIKFREICNILEVAASNGRVLLHRARRTLYRFIDEQSKD